MLLGLDLARKHTGYAILSDKNVLLKYGDISYLEEEGYDSLKSMLHVVDSIIPLFKKYNIKEVSVEDVYFKHNVALVKGLSRLRGIVESAWYGYSKKEVYVYSTLFARKVFGIKGKVSKAEVVLEVCRRYRLLGDVDLSYYSKKLDEYLLVKGWEKGKKEGSYPLDIKRKVSFKTLVTKLVDYIYEKHNISNDACDAVVIAYSLLKGLEK